MATLRIASDILLETADCMITDCDPHMNCDIEYTTLQKISARKEMAYIPKFKPINGVAGFDFMFLVRNETLRDNRLEHTASRTLILTEGKGESWNATTDLQNGRRFRAKRLQMFQFLKGNG